MMGVMISLSFLDREIVVHSEEGKKPLLGSTGTKFNCRGNCLLSSRKLTVAVQLGDVNKLRTAIDDGLRQDSSVVS